MECWAIWEFMIPINRGGKLKILFYQKEIKVIWLLFLSLMVFTYINYKISSCDIFNPGVIFSAMFLLFGQFFHRYRH